MTGGDQGEPGLMAFDPIQQHAQRLLVAECHRCLIHEPFVYQSLTRGIVGKEARFSANTFDLPLIDKGKGIYATRRGE